MDITKTRTELIREVAERLQIVGTGQSLEAEYADRISVNVDPILLQLARDGVCNVVDPESIPSEWFDALVMLVANVCAPVAGRGVDPAVKQFYEAQLRRTTAGTPTYAVQTTDYF